MLKDKLTMHLIALALKCLSSLTYRRVPTKGCNYIGTWNLPINCPF